MTKADLIFLDTETTGTGANDRICQVAYKFQGQEYEALFKPPVPIEVAAMAVSHITNRMVVDKEPFDNSAMYQSLAKIFAADHIFVAHNAQFDVEMLRKEGLMVGQVIDTLKVAQALDLEGTIPRYNMQYLRYYHDLVVEDATAHNALGDIRVLEKLFDFYYDQMLATFKDDTKVLAEMLAISARPVLIKRFNFGKYIGWKIGDVLAEDKGYLTWLFNQKIMARERSEENDEDWIYTLDYYLNPEK
jgi:DNA polymerase III epsilon subunit-like protein